MIDSTLITLPLIAIHIERSVRQRTDLTPESVLELACSIGQNGWVSPILVSKDDMHIIAGERRFTALVLLNAALNGDYSAFQKPEEARLRLAPVCKCTNLELCDWTHIPAQLGSNLTDTDKSLLELIENLHRQDLTWQDQAKACYELHEAYLRNAMRAGVKWVVNDTAQSIGLSLMQTSKYIRAWRETFMEDEKMDAIVSKSTSLSKAVKAIERVKSRRTDPLTLEPVVPTPKLSLDVPGVVYSASDRFLRNADFHLFAREYEGIPFNFIHCDFPYGIKYNSGVGQGTAADTQFDGEYDDSPEVYWALLETLCASRPWLIAPTAHIMFWFSQNLRRETEDFIMSKWPDAVIQKHMMIWHCSDNSGLVPDTQRYGRRTYETALLITLGDRKVASPKALSIAGPRNGPKIHRSQKPASILEHFFGMFVDDSSIVLDPTCGSASSVVAAFKHKAKYIQAVEYDLDMYNAAVRYVNTELPHG